MFSSSSSSSSVSSSVSIRCHSYSFGSFGLNGDRLGRTGIHTAGGTERKGG